MKRIKNFIENYWTDDGRSRKFVGYLTKSGQNWQNTEGVIKRPETDLKELSGDI
jgi:hypothetical protein